MHRFFSFSRRFDPYRKYLVRQRGYNSVEDIPQILAINVSNVSLMDVIFCVKD